MIKIIKHPLIKSCKILKRNKTEKKSIQLFYVRVIIKLINKSISATALASNGPVEKESKYTKAFMLISKTIMWFPMWGVQI